MIKSFYDNKRNGLYHDRVRDILIDRLVRKDSMTESHYHPYFELFYLVKGHCRIFVDHSLFFVSEGELVILPPSTLHRTQYDGQVERITLSFTKNYIGQIGQILGDGFIKENLITGKINFDSKSACEILSLFEELMEEDKRQDRVSEINRKSLILKLMALVVRNAGSRSMNDQAVNKTQLQIQKAARYIFENYGEDITLQNAAQVAGMRDTYFSRMFQEVTGYGFKEYLTNLRIQHSQELLLTTKLNITQIADISGFSNSNYFGDAFKKITGMSPRTFRARSKLKNL